MEKVKAFKGVISLVVTCLSALWGMTGWMVVALAVLMVIDWITGTAAACRSGTWSSSTAREGLWHKSGTMLAIAATGVLDMVLRVAADNSGIGIKYTLVFLPICIVWYILTEAGSIVENVGGMGAPVPPFLIKAISVLKAKTEKDQDDSIEQ